MRMGFISLLFLAMVVSGAKNASAGIASFSSGDAAPPSDPDDCATSAAPAKRTAPSKTAENTDDSGLFKGVTAQEINFLSPKDQKTYNGLIQKNGVDVPVRAPASVP